jgi:hypothetical protein
MADTEILPVIGLLVMMTDIRTHRDLALIIPVRILQEPDQVPGPTGLNGLPGKWISRSYPGISLWEEG